MCLRRVRFERSGPCGYAVRSIPERQGERVRRRDHRQDDPELEEVEALAEDGHPVCEVTVENLLGAGHTAMCSRLQGSDEFRAIHKPIAYTHAALN